jgi:hypothetical protein
MVAMRLCLASQYPHIENITRVLDLGAGFIHLAFFASIVTQL